MQPGDGSVTIGGDPVAAAPRVRCAEAGVRDVLAEGIARGLHKMERLMRAHALRARPRRRRLPKDEGDRLLAALSPNLLDRQFAAERPNQKWIADFTYVWTAEGWVYVAAVIDLFSRRVVGWSMKAEMTAQLVIERFYNAKRRHSTLGHLSPMEFEKQGSLA